MGSAEEKARAKTRLHILAVVVFDVVMIAEVAAAVYFANRDRTNFTPVFLRVFFGLLIPTLVVWRFGVRRVLSADCRREDN